MDFERDILTNLHRSDVVLLVVSEYTFDERIQRPGDWVRREIAEALALSKPLVLAMVDGRTPPVLAMVDGRTPPDAAELPEDIRAVAWRQGVSFPAEYWTAAVERLVGFIEGWPWVWSKSWPLSPPSSPPLSFPPSAQTASP